MSIINNNNNNNDEDQVVWRNVRMKGFFHKHIASVQIVSNHFVELQTSEKGQPDYAIKRIPLSEISDVLVENKHSVSNSTYQGFTYGRYGRNFYGVSRSRGVSVGDIVFLDRSGAVCMIFKDLADQNGVLNLIKSEHKRLSQQGKE